MIRKLWRKSCIKKYLQELIDARIEVYEKKTRMINHEKSIINNEYSLIDPKIIKYLSDASDPLVCIDVGAHKGDFVNELSHCVELEKILLIEPIPEFIKYLKEKFNNNKYITIPNAISDIDNAEMDFFINEMPATSSLFEFNNEMEELNNINTKTNFIHKVYTKTLDSITSECNLKKVDILKIDVQGAEHMVINGSKETLKMTKYIFIELSFKPLYHGSSVFHEIYQLLVNQGFIMLEIIPGYRSSFKEILQVDAFFVNKSLL